MSRFHPSRRPRRLFRHRPPAPSLARLTLAVPGQRPYVLFSAESIGSGDPIGPCIACSADTPIVGMVTAAKLEGVFIYSLCNACIDRGNREPDYAKQIDDRIMTEVAKGPPPDGG